MITLKFGAIGHQIQADVSSLEEAASLINSIGGSMKPKARMGRPPKAKAPIDHSSRRRSGVARDHAKWTVEEVRAIHNNGELSIGKLRKLPELQGRSYIAVSAAASIIRSPERLSQASGRMQRLVREVAGTTNARGTGLLD